MALDICHISASQDIDGAKLHFMNYLLTYCGDFAIECVSDAHRLIKIMNFGYALSISTGFYCPTSSLKTSSKFFNNSVRNLQDRVKRN